VNFAVDFGGVLGVIWGVLMAVWGLCVIGGVPVGLRTWVESVKFGK
jgi:hypothetical protein